MADRRRSKQRHVRRRYRPIGGTSIDALTPLGISGLQVWLDAGTLAGADGDAVTTWTDMSGNGVSPTQAVAGAKPTLQLKELNGRSVVRFDGGDYLVSGGFTLLPQPTTFFIVGKQSNIAADSRRFMDGDDGTNRQVFGTSATTWVLYAGGVATAGTSDTNNHIFGIIFNGATTKLYVGGTDTAIVGNPSTSAIDGLVVGALNDGTLGTVGDIAELMLYDGALSVANLNLIGNYLSYKYGLTWTTVA